MIYIHVTHNDNRKLLRIINDLSLGDTIEYILQMLNIYIYSLEKIVINGTIDVSEKDMNEPTTSIVQHPIRIVLHDRLKDSSGNILNRDNPMIENYMRYVQMRNDNLIATGYQNHLNRFDRHFNRNYESRSSRPLMNSVNNLNNLYSNLNRNPDPPAQSTADNLESETTNYNNLYNSIMSSLNRNTETTQTRPVETLEMEFHVTPIQRTASDTSGNDISGNYYSSVLGSFSNIINRNYSNFRNSGGTVHYQTIPLTSYSNIFTNLLNSLGLNATGTAEDVKMVLTNEEIAQLKRVKFKDISGCEEGQDKCTVCLEEFNDDDDMIELKCGHHFHEECIVHWFKTCSNKCPICREEVARGVPDFSTTRQPQAEGGGSALPEGT
jgi:hypothetical protein